MVDNIESDTSKVEGIGGNRRCAKCGVTKQWRQGQWVCLDHENAVPADWKHPMSHKGLTVHGGLEEKDRVTITQDPITDVTNPESVTPSAGPHAALNPTPVKGLITIPDQARAVFQKLAWFTLQVQLTTSQAENLLNELNEMPTPQKMSDAKAIIKLVNELESYLQKEK